MSVSKELMRRRHRAETASGKNYEPGVPLCLVHVYRRQGVTAWAIPLELVQLLFDSAAARRTPVPSMNLWTRPNMFHVRDGLLVLIPAKPTDVVFHYEFQNLEAEDNRGWSRFVRALSDPFGMTLADIHPEFVRAAQQVQEDSVEDKPAEWWVAAPERVTVCGPSGYGPLMLNTRLAVRIDEHGGIRGPEDGDPPLPPKRVRFS